MIRVMAQGDATIQSQGDASLTCLTRVMQSVPPTRPWVAPIRAEGAQLPVDFRCTTYIILNTFCNILHACTTVCTHVKQCMRLYGIIVKRVSCCMAIQFHIAVYDVVERYIYIYIFICMRECKNICNIHVNNINTHTVNIGFAGWCRTGGTDSCGRCNP